MAAHKGHVKAGGRKKGTPNKLNVDLRTYIKNILEDNIERVRDDLESLDSKDRLIMFEKFLQYIIPRKKEEEITISERDKFMKKFFGNQEQEK